MIDLMPIKKTGGMPVLQKMRGTSLTVSAAQAILKEAIVVSEGTSETSDGENYLYRGSTLVTVDIDQSQFDVPKTPEMLDQLRCAAERSVLFRVGLLRVARKEAERRAYPRYLREMIADTTFRIVDRRLLIDIDVECPLADVMGHVDTAKKRTVR
jgi:hypothetical protein